MNKQKIQNNQDTTEEKNMGRQDLQNYSSEIKRATLE